MDHRKARRIGLMLGMAVGFFNFASIFSFPEVMSADAPKPRIMFITTGGTIAHRENPDGSNSRIELPEVVANIRKRYPQPDVIGLLESIQRLSKKSRLWVPAFAVAGLSEHRLGDAESP